MKFKIGDYIVAKIASGSLEVKIAEIIHNKYYTVKLSSGILENWDIYITDEYYCKKKTRHHHPYTNIFK